jgi:ATP synthase I chain
MTDPDLALDRIRKATFALAAGGAIGAFAWRGWTWGAGFILGSAVSWLNYTILKQVAYATGQPQTRKRLVVFMGLRYLIFGGGAYVILRFSKISMPAVLLGLFVSVAAVIVEIIIQLAYAPRT